MKRAAAQGHTRAKLALAAILLNGEGRPADREAAGELFVEAAEAGEPHALYQAGLMFLTGDGAAA